MRLVFLQAFILIAMLLAGEAALAQSCQQLWVERNSYYKAHGYCFKTQRAIRYFGNRGCFIYNEEDVPLTGGERNRIAQIKAQERRFGCGDG